MGNFLYELSEGREVTTIDDFFEFLRRNVPKGTFAYSYYTYPVKMNKFAKTADGMRGEPNEYIGRAFKHKPFEFHWEQTYAEAMRAKNPDYVFKGGTTEYTPVEGEKIVQNGPNGMYFPIVPTGGGGKPVYTIDWEIVDGSILAPFLPPERPFDPNTPYPIPMLMDRLAGLSAGGAFWKNPDFKFQYMGQNAAKFQ